MKKQIQVFLLFFSILLAGTVKAQNSKVDSLENLLRIHQSNDTVKVNLLNKIAEIAYRDSADKAYDYANKAVELSDKLNYKKGKAKSFYVIGTSLSFYKSDKQALDYYLKALKIAEELDDKKGISMYLISCGIKYAAIGDISDATAYYSRALKIAEELNDQLKIAKCLGNLSVIYSGKGDYVKALEGYQKILQISKAFEDKSMLSKTYNNIGEINKYQGNYPKALEFQYKSLKIKEEMNDETGILLGYLNIGSIHTLQGNYKDALEYVRRALKIAEKLNDKRNISLCYEEIGKVYLKTNKLEALDYFQKALTIAEELSYQTPILNISSKIGDFYRGQGDYTKALVNYSKALKISEELKRKRTICETYIKIGDIHFLQKEYIEALKYSYKSLELANELKLLSTQKDIHHQLSEIYEATNDYRNAYIHHKLYTEINDSVYNEKNVKKIAELEYTYKFEKEKQAIELEQQKKDAVQAAEKKQHRIILFSLSIAFILMCLLALFLYRSYWFKHKTNITLTKQKREIEALNEEYMVINEELMTSNEELVITKNLVEERENLLIQITDNIPVFISLVDTDLKYRFANNGYAEIFDRQKKDIHGKKVKDILSADSYERAYPNITKTLEGQIVTYENVLRQKDGRQRILQTTYVPYYKKSKIQGLIVCSDDITERKKAEQALIEVEAEKAKLMAMEIERIGKELESNQKSVTAATLKLIQNSERDAQTIERLTEIEDNTNSTGKQKISTLISDYKRISYNSNWDEFEILFEKVHSSFYEQLNTQFPTLTANDRKICAFLKLNMSSKEIAQITFQSEEALKKARLRLRQKLEISRETNLVTFLQNI